MVVRVKSEKGKCDNFYEGNVVRFSRVKRKEGGSLLVTVESKTNTIDIELDEGHETHVFLMNDYGKTIEKIFV